MKVLAFETSSRFLSVAVTDDDRLISGFHKDVGVSQSSKLVPVIKDVLEESGLKLKELDLIALGIGPGSFTGLRIGVSTAKALALVTGIPVVSVATLDVIAYNFRRVDGYIAPLLDARKDKVYSAIYESDMGEVKRVSDYILADIDKVLSAVVGPTLFFGDGLGLYGKYMKDKNPLVKLSSDSDWYPRAEVVAKLAIEKRREGFKENIDTLVPMYMHPRECNVRMVSKK